MRPLNRAATGALLVAVFIVALVYGAQLPILPLLLERSLGSPTAAATNTGLLAGVYAFALFLFAPLWGRISDRWQRRGVIIVGLVGLAFALMLLRAFDRIVALYMGEFLAGAFSAAVLPGALALVADSSPDEDWRGRRFAWLNIANLAGFLIGPVLGGLLGAMWQGEMPVSGAPFTFLSVGAVLSAAGAHLLLPRRSTRPDRRVMAPRNRAALRLLLPCAGLVALGLGTFEVGLTIRGLQQLRLTPAEVGFMFAECMVIMAASQLIVFNRWFPVRTTRWLLAPAFIVFAIALLMLPLAASATKLFWAVAAVGASAGVLSPVIAFWISLNAGQGQGRKLGWQAAAASFGLGVGSVLGGLSLGTIGPLHLPFVIAAAAGLLGALLTAAFAVQPARHVRL